MDRYLEFVTNHWMLFIALCVVTFLLIQDFLESALQKFESISPPLAVSKMNEDNTVILDVRENNEFSNGHIAQAINSPLGKLDNNINSLNLSKESPLIVICQSGTRSAPACKKLEKHGFTNIFSIKGGMQAWEDCKLPIIK